MGADPKRSPTPGGEPTTDPAGHAVAQSITQAEAPVDVAQSVTQAEAFAPTLTRGASGSAAGVSEDLATELAGRYERRGELGRGGQSIVTRAWDRQLGREVAIKELHGAPSAGASERFLREARITARLEHPNIVPVYEIGRRADGTLYCVQKLVSATNAAGQPSTLRRALLDAGTLEQRLQLLPHFVDLCHGIAYAHAQGVLHRDIKPENVVVGRFGETVILDWGLARSGDDAARPAVNSDGSPTATVAGLAYGTPSYMSPEQARGETTGLDARADVFSLGAVLFEILTGRPPFLGTSAEEIIRQVLATPVPDPSALAPQAPRELVAIAVRALQKEPTARFSSAQAVAEEVSAWQNGQRVSVYAYSLFELIKLFLTRHRIASTVALAAFVLISVTGAFAWSRYGKARTALSLALVERARQADRALLWNQAAVLYAAARVYDDNPITQWGVRISGARRTPPPILLRGHTSGARGVAFSPDGDFVATAGVGGGVRLYKVPEGTLEATLWDRGTFDVTSVTWAPDGKTLATTSEDGRALLWDTSSRSIQRVLATSDHPFNAFAFSPDGQLGVLGSEDGWVELIDLRNATQTLRVQIETGLPHPIYAIAFHPSGQLFAVGTWSGLVQVLSRDGKLVQQLERSSGIRDLEFSDDARLFAYAGKDHLIRVYRVKAAEAVPLMPLYVLEGHDRKITSLAFSPGSGRLASASTDHTVRTWSMLDGRAELALSLGGEDQALGLDFDPAGKFLAVARANSDAELHRVPDEENVAGVDTTQSFRAMSSAVAKDLVITATDRTWVLEGPGLTRSRTFEGATTSGKSLQVTRSGRFAAWPCQEVANSPAPEHQRVCWVDLEGSLGLQKLAIPMMAWQAAISPNGDQLVASDDGRVVQTWSLPDGTPRGSLKGGVNGAFAFDYSPDGQLVAAGTYEKKIYVWKVATGELLKVLEGHTHGVRRVRFSPDGKTLASSSWDTTIRLWDVATLTGRAVCRGHEDHASTVDWSPDSSWLVSGARDGTLRIWDARDCSQLAQIVADEVDILGAIVLADGTSLAYQGTKFHRFPLDPLTDPAAHLREVERATGLQLDGAELEVRTGP